MVHSIHSINIMDQNFEAKVFLEAKWNEKRENLDKTGWEKGEPGDKMWTPYIAWQNRIDTTGEHEKWYSCKELNPPEDDTVRIMYQSCFPVHSPWTYELEAIAATNTQYSLEVQ